jgi:hypothetical protein
MTCGTVPAAETGHRSEIRISRWLNPGRRRTTDRVVGAVPACCRPPLARCAFSTFVGLLAGLPLMPK